MATVTSGLERWASDTRLADSKRGAAIELAYHPFEKQMKFHASPAKYRLFGGAAGPGKSKALLMEAILQAHEHGGANTLLLRRTFPELEQSLLLYFRRDVPRELYSSFHESKHTVTWRNGSTTRFGYCAREHDVYQYQGAEFLFIGIDELTLFTLRQWQFLTSRNRCPVADAFPCMAGATNPGNIGHAWVKALWIDREPAPGMEHPDQYDPADYDFISARVSDNPIYAGDENYLKTLRALPSHLRRAFLDGDWDVFAGQYFDRFDFARHVVRAEQVEWKPWWPRWISIDWGFEHPAAAYWHTAAPGRAIPQLNTDAAPSAQPSPCHSEVGESGRAEETVLPLPGQDQQQIPRTASRAPEHQGKSESARDSARDTARDDTVGRVVTYREYATHRTAPRELAREIVARSLLSDNLSSASAASAASAFAAGAPFGGALHGSQDSSREKIDAIYLSPDAFARRTDEASIAEQMGEVFAAAGMPRPTPADDDRVGGWMLMYQMLDADEWLLMENCIELLRTLPNLVRDSARVEDVEKMDGDDSADAARYGLKSRYGSRRGRSISEHLPLDQRLAARVVSDDPTIRAIQARKAQIEETQRGQPVSFLHRRRYRDRG